VSYALPLEVVEDNVPCTFREAELCSESELRRKVMVEEIESIHVNNTWNSQSYLKERTPLDANEFMQRKEDLRMVVCITRPDL